MAPKLAVSPPHPPLSQTHVSRHPIALFPPALALQLTHDIAQGRYHRPPLPLSQTPTPPLRSSPLLLRPSPTPPLSRAPSCLSSAGENWPPSYPLPGALFEDIQRSPGALSDGGGEGSGWHGIRMLLGWVYSPFSKWRLSQRREIFAGLRDLVLLVCLFFWWVKMREHRKYRPIGLIFLPYVLMRWKWCAAPYGRVFGAAPADATPADATPADPAPADDPPPRTAHGAQSLAPPPTPPPTPPPISGNVIRPIRGDYAFFKKRLRTVDGADAVIINTPTSADVDVEVEGSVTKAMPTQLTPVYFPTAPSGTSHGSP
ncbi:hypothetical protein B9479_003487 [Cryptococcus floricola]|uniref:Uncharacterized protein n=1 Tax=Cryptococcus floricola TaxID=2591691 RepID=A0A5D3AWP7_9TREE|nr:hypothetical protein B9479_003487 [Cryptococcus floricola]